MDSRLIAGAYSQHFRALEQEAILNDTGKYDSIAKAKKLSQETNKRRKIQAQKRKLEAKREERRRQEILSKRREEQNQATEKYQRSHLPPSSRQGSGRFSPRRYTGSALEDALRLIRGSPRQERIRSARERSYAKKNSENENPLERSYFGNPRQMLRPSSARPAHQLDANARAELLDVSMQNLTSSKTLFEQQLEQQQNLLLEKQQQALREFNNAMHQELDGAGTAEEGNTVDSDDTLVHSESCSSLDSLEGDQEKSQGTRSGAVATQPSDQPLNTQPDNMSVYPESSQQQQEQQSKMVTGQNDSHHPLQQDMTASALYQQQPSICGLPRPEGEYLQGVTENLNQLQHNHSYIGLTREDIIGAKKQITDRNSKADTTVTQQQKFQLPVKQFSIDSLDSCSSTSTLSISKTVEVTPSMGSRVEAPSASAHVLSNQSQTVTSAVFSPADYKSSASSAGNALSKGQMAWVSPGAHSDPIPPTSLPTSTHLNEPVVDSFHPRYVSAIGSSIWPGQSMPHGQVPTSVLSTLLSNNTHPYSTRGTLTNVTSTTSYPASVPAKPMPNTTSYSATGAKADTAVKPSITASKPLSAQTALNNNNANGLSSLNKQDFMYPHYQSSGTAQATSNEKQIPPNSQHYQANACTSSGVPANIGSLSTSLSMAPSGQVSCPVSSTSSHIAAFSQLPGMQTMTAPAQQPQPLFHVVSGSIPVPAVRTVFPSSRPPAPVNSGKMEQIAGLAVQTKTPVTAAVSQTGEAWPAGHIMANIPLQDHNGGVHKADVVEDVNSESEDMIPLKGILKPALPKSVPQGQGKPGHQGHTHPRDSLELTRLQTGKKPKKKSVRFADYHTEENDVEAEEEEISGPGGFMMSATGTSVHRTPGGRPVSAKVVSMTPKPEVKGQRANSAGTVRQYQYSNSSHEVVSSGLHHRSNLPSSFVVPLHTTTPINRPKAAAHIIMSTEAHHDNKLSNGQDTHSYVGTSASTAHKSHLESKLKTVNNNFMSRVPVRVPNHGDANAVVYHVSQPDNDSNVNMNGNNATDGNSYQTSKEPQHQHQTYERSRLTYSATKRVPVSNNVVTRTSIVPASTKITYPQANNGLPSYSTTTGNAAGNVVYDENGLRIDRTPTDEEITRLWDNVRNCLSKEEGGGGRYQPAGNSTGEPGVRQAPTMSTKLIDGASLGFGTTANTNGAGMNGLRTGSGFYHPRTAPTTAATTQNKVKPALQQQGSYLRRFGLLKQRRVSSATVTGSPAQTTGQRVSSAVYGRHNAGQLPQPTSAVTQPQQRELPMSMALTYQPQDEVSESTAAFIMAERLAKQSLSDSHIQMAMEDAHSKQEAHNKSKMAASRDGHSALSLEEQRLLESLDKLNDRLKGTESKYNGTIHYHQPYQAHLPGFRGHTPVIDTRRNALTSPRSQQRAHSARIRQQTRQYR